MAIHLSYINVYVRIYHVINRLSKQEGRDNENKLNTCITVRPAQDCRRL